MNATPMNVASGNAVQPAQQAGKSADAGTSDVPFNQVLSSEIAQKQKSEAAKGDSSANTKPDAATPTDGSAEGKSESKVDSAQLTKTDEKAVCDSDKHDAASTAASTENVTVAPEILLGLPINPDALKPAVVAAGTQADDAQDAAPKVASDRSAAAAAAAAALRSGSQRGTQKLDPRLSSSKEAIPAAPTTRTAPTDAAATFQGQLAAVRHADATKTGEVRSDLVSNPALRVGPHALIDSQLAPVDALASRLAPSVGTTAWGQALGEKLVWMASGTQQTASLTLNPPNLGPLQIVLHITNDQATASFFSAQPEVRQALEAAFPRLRDMMNDAGIQLGQATVSADTPQQNSTPDRQAQRITLPFSGVDDATSAALQAVQAPVRQSGRGLVDTFA